MYIGKTKQQQQQKKKKYLQVWCAVVFFCEAMAEYIILYLLHRA